MKSLCTALLLGTLLINTVRADITPETFTQDVEWESGGHYLPEDMPSSFPEIPILHTITNTDKTHPDYDKEHAEWYQAHNQKILKALENKEKQRTEDFYCIDMIYNFVLDQGHDLSGCAKDARRCIAYYQDLKNTGEDVPPSILDLLKQVPEPESSEDHVVLPEPDVVKPSSPSTSQTNPDGALKPVIESPVPVLPAAPSKTDKPYLHVDADVVNAS